MTLLACYFILLSAITIAIPFVSHFRGGTHLVSLRNLVLFSFFWYQTKNPLVPLFEGSIGVYPVRDPVASGWVFAGGATLFLGLFLAFYHWNAPARAIGDRFPKPTKSPSPTALLAIAITLAILGAGVKIAEGNVAGILSLFFGMSLLNTATALSAWLLARHWNNPIILVGAIAVVAVASLIAMSGFGRRPLVGVLLAFAFGFYFSRFFGRPLFKALIVAAMAAYPLLLVLNTFSALRTQEYKETGPVQKAQLVVEHITSSGPAVFVPGSGFNRSPEFEGSLWVIENYPERFSKPPLFAVWYTFANTIPRAFWQDKPAPITTEMARHANVDGVDQDEIKLTVGVVGEAFADRLGWVAVVAYAAFIATFVRFFDRILENGRDRVLVVAAICVNLGQFVGLCRGSVPNFLNIYLVSFFAVYPILLILSMFFGRQFGTTVVEDADVDDSYEDYESDGDWRHQYDEYP